MLPMAGADRSNLSFAVRGAVRGAMSQAAGNRSALVTVMAANEHHHPGSVTAPLTCPHTELLVAVEGCGGAKCPLQGCKITSWGEK